MLATYVHAVRNFFLMSTQIISILVPTCGKGQFYSKRFGCINVPDLGKGNIV